MNSALEIWLNTFTSEWTKRQYRSYVRNFMTFIYGTGDTDELADQYLEEKRDDIAGIMRDIDRYWASTTELVAKTRLNKLTGIKIFLRDNYVELHGSFWRKFVTRGFRPRPVSKETMISSSQIRSIISHLRAVGTAVIMICIATGARIGEVLKIHLTDLALELEPPRIYLRAETTKNREARVVFLTEEAREAVRNWLAVRDHYIENKRDENIRPDDPRLFPFCHQNVYAFWYDALRLVGLDQKDEKTGRWLVRIHGFRKRFRTLLGTVIPVDIVETMMGHQGYLTVAYRRHSEEDLAAWYEKGSHVLMLHPETAELTRTLSQHEETVNLLRQIETKDAEIRQMALEIDELKSQFTHVKFPKPQ